MKKKILLLQLTLFLSLALFGQEGLIVKNIRTGKAWMYEKNSRITYILFNEPEYATGILNALLDSAVVLGKDTIALKDIAGLRKKSPGHNIARIVGMPLMLIGSLFMGQGIADMYSNSDSGPGVKAFLLGAGIFSIGYIPYELNMEDLTVGYGGRWMLQISKGNT